MKLFYLLVVLTGLNCSNTKKDYNFNQKEIFSKEKMELNQTNMKKTEMKDIINPKAIVINYNMKLKLDDKLSNFPDDVKKQVLEKMGGEKSFKLSINDNESLYSVSQDMKINSERSEHEEPGKKTTSVNQYSIGFSNYYKNFENGKMIEQRFLRENTYLIERSIENFKWSIKSDVYDISGYKCKLAETTHNSNLIRAWFTEDIAVSDGPLIYNGLPGLILKIETPDREIYATKIEFLEDVKIEKPIEGEVKTKEEMDKMLEELKNRQGYERKEGNKTEKMTIIRSN